MAYSTVDIFAGVDALPHSGTAIVAGDYKATDPNPAEFATHGMRAFAVTVDVSAQSGANNNLSVNIEGFDPASGKWITVTSLDIVTVAKHVFTIDPRGDGVLKHCRPAQPAAGAAYAAVTVPDGCRWELVSADWQCATSASALNRNHELLVKNASGQRIGASVSNAQVASTTARITAQTGSTTTQGPIGATTGVRLPVNMPFAPGVLLSPGSTITVSSLAALDGTDQLSDLTITVRERIPALYSKMRVRPVGSGTRTTLTYSVGLTALA